MPSSQKKPSHIPMPPEVPTCPVTIPKPQFSGLTCQQTNSKQIEAAETARDEWYKENKATITAAKAALAQWVKQYGENAIPSKPTVPLLQHNQFGCPTNQQAITRAKADLQKWQKHYGKQAAIGAASLNTPASQHGGHSHSGSCPCEDAQRIVALQRQLNQG